SAWQNRIIDDKTLKEESHRTWKKILENGIPALQLPKESGGDKNDKSGAAYRCMIGQDTTEKALKLAQENQTTLFMVMFSTYLQLLSRYTNQEEIA
ncbi:MAG: hypothetical protein GY765_30145, partial [bacterium]|nr:hypothetical protein [bacterium]